MGELRHVGRNAATTYFALCSMSTILIEGLSFIGAHSISLLSSTLSSMLAADAHFRWQAGAVPLHPHPAPRSRLRTRCR